LKYNHIDVLIAHI